MADRKRTEEETKALRYIQYLENEKRPLARRGRRVPWCYDTHVHVCSMYVL